MWKGKEKEPVFLFLLLIIIFWVISFVILKLLQPYSVEYTESGNLTVGYIAYAVIGLIFTTPAPFLSMLILSLGKRKITLKEFFVRIFYTEKPVNTIIITGFLCGLAMIFALVNGKPNGSPWYIMPLGFLLMIPFVGIAEETGWRGFLQPAIDKKVKYPFSVFIVSAIWLVWHIDQWFDTTSRHYGDSFLGFAIMIFIWAFALAALYKATESVIACAVYHAFIDSIGAVYDWNSLFDAFPGNTAINLYRITVLLISVALWIYSAKNRKIGTDTKKRY